MLSPPGGGTCLMTMFVVYAATPTTAPAQSASSRATSARCVSPAPYPSSMVADGDAVLGECNHSFHMVC